GWFVLGVATGSAAGLSSGEAVRLRHRGLPPLSPQGRGPQAYALWTRGGASGVLAPIASPPTVTLTSGAATALAFADPSPLFLTPLQAGATVLMKPVDLCGNDKPAASTGTLIPSLVVSSAGALVADGGTLFRNLGGVPILQVFMSTGPGPSS